jgi:hypothetical protein
LSLLRRSQRPGRSSPPWWQRGREAEALLAVLELELGLAVADLATASPGERQRWVAARSRAAAELRRSHPLLHPLLLATTPAALIVDAKISLRKI